MNQRLAHEEAEAGDGDPAFPKQQWPPRALCAPCHQGATATADATALPQWNTDEVLHFLLRHYGEQLTIEHTFPAEDGALSRAGREAEQDTSLHPFNVADAECAPCFY